MLIFTLFMQTSQATEYCTEGNAEQREACLRAKIADLERSLSNRPPAQNDEDAAKELYERSKEAMANNEPDRAKEILQELERKYPRTRTYRSAKRMLDELDMFGVPMPDVPEFQWIQDSAPKTIGQSDLTILIFWEVWCPHCKREVPVLNTTYEKYSDRGLKIVGFTKLSRGKTEDEVKTFLSENDISFPIAKESGDFSDSFNVSGIPAVAIVQNGTVIWRGHPARVTDEMLEKWLEADDK